MSIWLEQRLDSFSSSVDKVMDGALGQVRLAHVTLPGGEAADVALKLHLVDRIGWLSIQGLARYESGRVVGELHTQELAPDPAWLDGHEHTMKCEGFVYADGRFQDPGYAHRKAPWSYDSRRDAALTTASLITRRLIETPPVHNVFGSDGDSLALRRARRLRGKGTANELLFDLALRTALDERLAAGE